MILRSGIDILEISRLDEINPAIRERFIARVYTADEIAQAKNHSDTLTGLFSAKEAVSKALGTGIGAVHWQDIEILHLPSGQPIVILYGQAKIIADQLGLTTWSVSISHDRDRVVALAVAIGE
ncbi:MAG: holo-ACP synthase [Brevefilum sp.]|nr:holo-ACP synthase [Brevefilum sp.]